jgi:Protein of unknown function (DUF1573)
MKTPFRLFYLVLGVSMLALACNTQNDHSADAEQLDGDITKIVDDSSAAIAPKLVFEKEVHDFGQINQGEKVLYSFKFTNTGAAPLIISRAYGSCGCTVPKYPKEPIAPGESSTIDVSFDSEGKKGIVKKKVTILSNGNPSENTCKIKASIISTK